MHMEIRKYANNVEDKKTETFGPPKSSVFVARNEAEEDTGTGMIYVVWL